jgi:hypothetical protein
MASSVELRFGEIFLAIEEAKDADVHYKRLLTFVEDLVYSKTRPHPVHLTTPGYAKNVSRALIHLSGRVAEKSTGAKLKANSEIAFKALLLLVNEGTLIRYTVPPLTWQKIPLFFFRFFFSFRVVGTESVSGVF